MAEIAAALLFVAAAGSAFAFGVWSRPRAGAIGASEWRRSPAGSRPVLTAPAGWFARGFPSAEYLRGGRRSAPRGATTAAPRPTRVNAMELIAALLIAAPVGYFARTARAALLRYLVLWAVILPIQTIVVSDDKGIDGLYPVVNAAILALGIGLNRLGYKLGRRRRKRQAEATLVPRNEDCG